MMSSRHGYFAAVCAMMWFFGTGIPLPVQHRQSSFSLETPESSFMMKLIFTNKNSIHQRQVVRVQFGNSHILFIDMKISNTPCFTLFLAFVTSSSPMAHRPCDYLRLKSSLCSCQHCQWFCAGRRGRDAVVIRQARITRQKRHLPNAYEILFTRYDQSRTGVGHFR